MRIVTVAMLPLLGACSDYEFFGPKDVGLPAEPPGQGTADTADSADTSVPLDTGEGVVETGECADLAPAPAGHAGPATCTALNEVDWDLVIEWERTGSDAGNTTGFPAVVSSSGGGSVVAAPAMFLGVQLLDGGTGRLASVIALDDYDDGVPVSLGRDEDGALLAAWGTVSALFWWTESGSVVTRFDGLSETSYGVVRWADVDGDGVLELVSRMAAVRADGSTVASFAWEPNSYQASTFAAGDFDGDGGFEVANIYGIWDAVSGAVVPWSGPIGYTFQAAPVQIDGVVDILGTDGNGAFRARPDGEMVWRVSFPAHDPGGIAVGDVDGDGIPEMVVATTGSVMMLDADGNTRWVLDTGTQSGAPVMADLDADGSYEVIAFGQSGLQILKGSDGTVLARAEVYSAISLASPVVADIDHDGSAEIVVVGFDSAAGDTPVIRAYGAASGRWARTRPVWNAFDYDVTSVGDDGQVIAWPIPSWEAYNSFRAQPAHDGDHADLTLLATDLCCDSEVVHLAVQAQNLGSAAAVSGAIVRLLTNDGTGWREVASQTLVDGVSPESSAAGFLFEVPRADWGLRQVLQIDGADGDECDRVNDRVPLSLACEP